MRRAGSIFTAIILLCGLPLVASPSASAAQGLTCSFGAIELSVHNPPWDSNPSHLKVIDIKDYSRAARAVAYLWHKRFEGQDKGPTVCNQRWRVEPTGHLVDGHRLVRFVNDNSGMCLDESMDRPAYYGTPVYQYPCTGAPNQSWEIVEPLDAGGFGRLRNDWEIQTRADALDAECLDVDGPWFQDGAILHMWGCGASWSQLWNVQP
jgi:Ricin-type beta-trefoil lectin domain-like